MQKFLEWIVGLSVVFGLILLSILLIIYLDKINKSALIENQFGNGVIFYYSPNGDYWAKHRIMIEDKSILQSGILKGKLSNGQEVMIHGNWTIEFDKDFTK